MCETENGVRCSANYIGKTLRNLNKRNDEHTNGDSAISQHCKNQDHKFDFENVEILDRADRQWQTTPVKMLHIRNLAPTLNVQDDSTLFTLIIRNAQKKTDKTNDKQKYVSKKSNAINKAK